MLGKPRSTAIRSSDVSNVLRALGLLERFPGWLYVTLNTGVPSRASVEKLFSLGGRIFTPLRSRMTSEHFEFEMMCCGVGSWD